MALARVGSIQSNRVTSGSTTSSTRTLVAGNLVIVFAHSNNESVTASIADTGSNTWNLVSGAPWNSTISGGDILLYVWWSIITNAGSSTITVTWSGSGNTYQHVLAEYSGTDTSAPLVNQDIDQTNLGTAHGDNATFTTTDADVVLTAYGAFEFSTGTCTAGANWVEQNDANERYYMDRIVSATGTYTGDYDSVSSRTSLTWLGAWKAAAAAPATSDSRLALLGVG